MNLYDTNGVGASAPKPDLKALLTLNTVHFSHYRKGFLYYTITAPWNKEATWSFPVPIEDTGDATFNATEKALYFMRYIRKAQEEGSFVKVVL